MNAHDSKTLRTDQRGRDELEAGALGSAHLGRFVSFEHEPAAYTGDLQRVTHDLFSDGPRVTLSVKRGEWRVTQSIASSIAVYVGEGETW